MINPLNINDSTENKITYYHLLAFLVTLPFDRFYSQLVFISLLLHTIINLRRASLKYVWKKETLILQSVFLVTVISTAWSAYATHAFGVWEKQVSVFLFPLVFALNSLNVKKYANKLMAGFGFTCVLVVLYLYSDALRIIYYYHFPLKKLFTIFFLNHNFSRPIGLHATYLSLYVAVSIIAFTGFLLREKTSRTEKIFYLLSIGILAAALLQLASRSVLIGLLVILNCVVPFFCGSKKSSLRFLAVSFTSSMILIFCIAKTDMLNMRLLQGLKNDLSTESTEYSATNPRAERWNVAFGLVKESPVIGYGAGSEVPVLKEKYFENKLYDSYLNELNAHNQYLSFLITSGLAGLVIFLFTIGWGLRRAIKTRDLLFTGFLILVAIVCVSENILDVNKGIFFYAFFFSLFACPGQLKVILPEVKPEVGNPAHNKDVFLYKEVTH
jgi:O-antigen ligase